MEGGVSTHLGGVEVGVKSHLYNLFSSGRDNTAGITNSYAS